MGKGRSLRPWIVAVLLATIIVVFPGKVSAKLVVPGPEQAIEGAPIVVTATVVVREYSKPGILDLVTCTEEQRSIVLQINAVLKGEVDRIQLSWQRAKPMMYGWLGFDFPEPGTEVMLLLRQDGSNYHLAWDLNCVALVEDGRITELYQGATIGSDEHVSKPADYARAYEAFYQANIERAKPVVRSAEPTTGADVAPLPTKGIWLRLLEMISGWLQLNRGKAL